MTKDEMDAIKEELDERYVKQDKCNEIQAENKEILHEQDLRLTVATHDLRAIKKTQFAIFGAIVSGVVAAVIDILLKIL